MWALLTISERECEWPHTASGSHFHNETILESSMPSWFKFWFCHDIKKDTPSLGFCVVKNYLPVEHLRPEGYHRLDQSAGRANSALPFPRKIKNNIISSFQQNHQIWKIWRCREKQNGPFWQVQCLQRNTEWQLVISIGSQLLAFSSKIDPFGVRSSWSN